MTESLRDQMMIADDVAYFDNAAVAPITKAAYEAIGQWARDFAQYGDAHWPKWRTGVEKTRRAAAQLLNANREEIALTHSTTEGINFVSEGFPWQEGDNVVLPTGEFPSNLYPWMMLESRGVEVRRVPMPENGMDLTKIREACDDRTRVVTCSWVGYSHGYRIDLDDLTEMVHEAGALVMVDAIQGLGVFPIDVQKTPIDFLSADGHKWMLGPEGAGIFYTRREHLDLLKPLGVGWNSVSTAGEFQHDCLDLRDTAARYEGGTFNMVGLAGFGASLQVLLDHAIENVCADLRRVSDMLVEELQSLGGVVHSSREDKTWSGILSVDLPGKDPFAVKDHAATQDVYFNSRNGHLRFSPHAFNTPADIEKLIDVLKSA